MSVSIWQILTAIAPILAPVVSLVLVLVGRIIWNHEKRIRSLEQSQIRHGRTLYGDEDDVQQNGITHDVRRIIERLDALDKTIDKLRDTWSDNDDD